MIRIEFEGTAREVRAEMLSLLQLDPNEVPTASEAAVAEAAVAEAAKPAKPRAKKADPTPVSEEGATSSETPSSAAVEVDVTSKDAVKAFVNTAATSLGTQTIAEVFGEIGATKFGEIDEKKWPGLVARIDDLLTAKA